MKRITGTIAFVLALGLLLPTTVEARGRKNENERQHTEQRQQRHGNQGQRPAANHVNDNRRPTNNSKPDNNRKKHPGYNHNNNHHGNNHGSAVGQRPPQSNRPSQQPGFRPQGNHHMTPPPPRPPHRPLMPAHRPWQRPTPPPAFRPAQNWRPFNSILGIALGSAINFTVNALINNGYNVSGYGSDAVYVTNAPMLNMVWPDATLYYGNGGLYGSEFVYSTPSYNLSRYNSAYNQLVMTYGTPVQVRNSGGVISSSWWGPGNQFITLTFRSGTAYNGTNRFFTTLSFGN